MSTTEFEKLREENDKLMSKLAWLLQRIVVKEGGAIHLPGYTPSGKEIIDSLKELDNQIQAQKA